MTLEERQLRARVRTVFRRAALRWLDRDTDRQRVIAVGGFEEVMTWQYNDRDVRDGSQDVRLAVVTWLADCWPRLTPQEQRVVVGLTQGLTSAEIARCLHCTPRTIRRIRDRIRHQCLL